MLQTMNRLTLSFTEEDKKLIAKIQAKLKPTWGPVSKASVMRLALNGFLKEISK
jgi:hypothetical protein